MNNVEEYLSNKGDKLAAKALTPLKINYRPEIDITEEFGDVNLWPVGDFQRC